jgi:hypothetical protein
MQMANQRPITIPFEIRFGDVFDQKYISEEKTQK